MYFNFGWFSPLSWILGFFAWAACRFGGNCWGVAPLTLALLVMPGCAGLQAKFAGTPTKADSQLDMGFGKKLRLGAETNLHMTGFMITSADGSKLTEIKEMTFTQSPAGTLGAWVGPMDAWTRQLVEAWKGQNESSRIWAPVVSNLIDKGFGALGLYIGSWQSVKTAELNKGGIVDQVVKAIIDKVVDRASVLPLLPTDIREMVESRLPALGMFEQ